MRYSAKSKFIGRCARVPPTTVRVARACLKPYIRYTKHRQRPACHRQNFFKLYPHRYRGIGTYYLITITVKRARNVIAVIQLLFCIKGIHKHIQFVHDIIQ